MLRVRTIYNRKEPDVEQVHDFETLQRHVTCLSGVGSAYVVRLKSLYPHSVKWQAIRKVTPLVSVAKIAFAQSEI